LEVKVKEKERKKNKRQRKEETGRRERKKMKEIKKHINKLSIFFSSQDLWIFQSDLRN